MAQYILEWAERGRPPRRYSASNDDIALALALGMVRKEVLRIIGLPVGWRLWALPHRRARTSEGRRVDLW